MMDVRNLAFLIICVGCTAAHFVNLSSSLEQSGRSHACPGENVTYTCEINSTSLQWLVDPYITEDNVVTFTRLRPPAGEVVANVPEAVRRLDSISPTLLSTMFLRPSDNVTDTTVVCRTLGGASASLPYSVLALPSPPENVAVLIVANETTSVTVNIVWDPSGDNSGGAVERYTVETSPETENVSVSAVLGTNMAPLDFSYNVNYTVRVTSVNCAGNSPSAMMGPIEFVNCFAPPSNPLITFEPYQSTTEGSVVSYQCRPGFIPEGRVMSKCASNRSWVPDPEQYSCIEVNCGAPVLPVNSSMVSGPSNGMREGSEVTFQCADGLFPSSEITIVCTTNETWYPDPQGIECAEESVSNCSRPIAPANGYLGEVTLKRVEFGCNEGYSPQDVRTAECVATNIWSPDPAQWECMLVTTQTTPGGTSGPDNTGAIIGSIVGGGAVVAFIALLIVVAVLLMLRKKKSKSKSEVMELRNRNVTASEEGTLNGEYSKLQHPDSEGYSVLQHPGPHGNKSSSAHPGGLVYADVGNFDPSSKKKVLGFEASSELDDKVQYSALTHKPAPPPDVAAIDKLMDLDSLIVQLKEVSSLWYELGEQLGMERETLNEIESQCLTTESRREEMFALYLRMERHPTWAKIAKALRTLGETTLAEGLENSYVTGKLPIQIDMNAVPASSYKHFKGPPPPLPPKSVSEFDFDDDTSSPAPLILPPRPPQHEEPGMTTSWKRPPPPVPQEEVVPPRPPKAAGGPPQPPRPPKPRNL